MPRHWTGADEARLRDMVAADWTAIEMAAAFDVTQQAVYRKLRRLGLYVSAAAISRAKSAASKRVAATPEGLAQRSRAGRSPKVRYGFKDPRAAQAAGVEKRYEGVPPEYRDHYRTLVYSKHIRSPAAKAMIAEMIAKSRSKTDGAMTPFERQLARVKAGARVQTLVTPQASDRTFSLTGSSLAL